MSINKLFLEPDGLVVGNNQLVTSGGGVSVGKNLVVQGTVTDSIGDIRSIPVNTQSSAYTLAKTDGGKMISITAGGVTVPNSNVISVGQTFSIFNNSNLSQTITPSSGTTMYLTGTALTGNRTLTQYGIATIVCVAANIYVIAGSVS